MTAQETLPTLPFPESAAPVLARVVEHARWRSEPEGIVPYWNDIDPKRARDVCRSAFHQLAETLRARASEHVMEGVVVQPMVVGAIEVMIGVTEDPVLGPVIAFGLGGIHVEILGDVRFRITPLTDRDATAMISGIRGFRLLQGYRVTRRRISTHSGDVLRVSRLVEEVPEIVELDLNPVFALAPGRAARLRTRASESRRLPAARGDSCDSVGDSYHRHATT
jgi:acyl-CoA synthetase (NDP forming)